MTVDSGRRARIASLERPLLWAGLALVTAHLLDLALSGPDPSVLGVLVILGLPLAWAFGRSRVTRPTRVGLGVVVGLLAVGFGVTSHGLHVVNAGLDWRDVTGVGYVAGGLLLVAAGLTAVAAPRRAPRRTGLGRRAAHGVGWLAGAAVVAAGLSLGGEVLLEAAAHDRRLAAVVSDGAARPVDMDVAVDAGASQRAITWLQMQMVRGISGMKSSPSLTGIIPAIAPRPVLLIAGSGFPEEIPASRRYRDAGGAKVQLWELSNTGHTAGLRKHPAAYERRTIGFLDRALGLR